MKRKVYVFVSSKGYLCDIEEYTNDVEKAVYFVDEKAATKKLHTINKLLKTKCLIEAAYIEFPKKHTKS